jgi:uncharacterized OsmC-like protein
MKTTVKLVHRGGMRCEAKVSGAGEVFRIDSTKYKGKPDYVCCPLDLLAFAHGSCTGILAAMKGVTEGVNTENMGIEVTHDYDDGPPMKLRTALIRFLLSGKVSAEQEAKMRASAEMCPVHTALRQDVSVTMEFVSKG